MTEAILELRIDTRGTAPQVSTKGSDAVELSYVRPQLVSRPRTVDETAERQAEPDRSSRNGMEPVYASAPKLIRLADIPPSGGRVQILQEWEGTVESVNPAGSEFTFIARDLTTTSNPEEEFTLSTGEVSSPDLPLLVPGGVFYWTLGYERAPGGQISRFSRIRFRRLPPPAPEETARAWEEAGVMLSEWSKKGSGPGPR